MPDADRLEVKQHPTSGTVHTVSEGWTFCGLDASEFIEVSDETVRRWIEGRKGRSWECIRCTNRQGYCGVIGAYMAQRGA